MDKNSIIDGIGKASQTIKGIHSSSDRDGIFVTVSAEPKVLKIELPESIPNRDELSQHLIFCLNKAIGDSKAKVIEQLSSGLNLNLVSSN